MRVKSLYFVAVLLALAPAAAAQPLTIVNGTHFAVLTVRVKPHSGRDWAPDSLHQKTLGVGEKRALGGDASCDADFLAVLSDGHKLVLHGADACRNGTVTLTDDRK